MMRPVAMGAVRVTMRILWECRPRARDSAPAQRLPAHTRRRGARGRCSGPPTSHPCVESTRRPCRAGTSPLRGLCTRRACRKSRPVQGGTADPFGGCATIPRRARGCRPRPGLASSCRGTPHSNPRRICIEVSAYSMGGPLGLFATMMPILSSAHHGIADAIALSRPRQGHGSLRVETPRRTAARPCANLEGRARGFFDAAARRRLRHGHISKRLPLCPRCASAIVPTTGRRTACPPTLWRYSA